MTLRLFLSLLLALALCCACLANQVLPYQGRVLSVVTGFSDISQILSSHIEGFRNLTGATVVITARPFGSLFSDVVTDLEQGSPFFDAFVFAPQWLSDLVDCRACQQRTNLLTPLSDFVKTDSKIDWLDVAVFFRQFSAVYDSDIYAIPLDGDVHYLHVRKDVLDRFGLLVPETWDEFLSAASIINGADYNNDTIPDVAVCVGMKSGSQAYWWPWTIYSPFIQSRGTAQGAFFDLSTMDPLVNNEGFIRAMQIYKQLAQFGPANALSIDVTATREMFRNGSCAMTLDWANPYSFMASTPFASGYFASVTPGTYQVVDRETSKLVNCTRSLCPHAEIGRTGQLLNRAPYAAFGGWSGSISGLIPQAKQELAYQFLSYLGRPSTSSIDVTRGLGFDLYRYSHLNVTNWQTAGFTAEYVARMHDTFGSVLSSPNLVIDLRIHGTNQYQQVALDPLVFSYVSGNTTISEMIRQLRDSWNGITEAFGRNEQIVSYRASIGAPKIIPCDSAFWNYTISACDANEEIFALYSWTEPKICSGGVALPTPVRLSRCNYVVLNSATGIGLTVASCVVIAFFTIIALLIFLRREEPIIRKSSWVFSIIIVFGGAIMNTFILSSIGAPDTGTCIINIWLLSVGYVLLFGGFLAKMYRIERLLNTPIAVKVIKISDVQLARILGALLIADIALLSTWTWLSPTPGPSLGVSTFGGNFSGRIVSCSGGSPVGSALLIVYKALMLGYAAFLSFRTRRAPAELSEQRFITTVILVVGFSAVVILPLTYSVESNKVLIASLGVLFMTASSIGIYTMPKIFESYNIAHFGFWTPPTGGGGSSESSFRNGSPHVHVGARSLPLQSSTQSNPYEVECPQCGYHFEH